MTLKKAKLITADFLIPENVEALFLASLTELLQKDDSVKAQYLLENLLSKYLSIDPGSASTRRSLAIEKWLATEERNALTNARLVEFGRNKNVEVLPGVSAKRFYDKVRSVVADVLPWTPSLSLEYFGFSGGASTSKSRRKSHPALKFSDQADITRPPYTLYRDLTRNTRWEAHQRESGLEPRFVEGNVMFTVPKNSTIDRVACKEPDLNMFLQRGFGYQIRSLLKRVGIDLNDQTRNQKLACEGSITGALCTIDLSSASDSVCTELIRLVLPPAWFHYLDLVRSTTTSIDSSLHTNEMFSSMGNGFTFELESLIFYSICRAVAYFSGTRGIISVYGDDLIVPTSMSADLFSALAFSGFSVNLSKTFVDGHFRESCGAHWYGGVDVSPFFIRGPIKRLSDLILTLNQLTSWSSREIGVVDPRYEDLLRQFFKFVPDDLWGGSDLTSRTSLVTGDAPRSELVYPTSTSQLREVGRLLLWLFSTMERKTEGCLNVSSNTLPSFARIRKRSRLRRERYRDDSNRVIVGYYEQELLHDVPVFLSRYG